MTATSPGDAFARWLATLEGRYAAIEQTLAAPPAADRDRVKRDIIGLFKEADAALTELTEFKESIRRLVDRYKQWNAAGEEEPAAPEPGPTRRADHLGASTFIEKGWSYISLGDFGAATEALRRALELAPGSVQAESLLGWALMLQGQYDDAMAQLSQVLMKEPGNALARVNVGYICLTKGIFGEAIEHLSRAIRLDSDRKATLYAHYYLGLVYLQREMYDDAQSFFRKTLALGPNLVEAHFDLGRACWFGGDRAGAMQAWRQGHAQNRFSRWAKRCQEMLDVAASGGEVPRGLLS